jgi:hypothetical protein
MLASVSLNFERASLVALIDKKCCASSAISVSVPPITSLTGLVISPSFIGGEGVMANRMRSEAKERLWREQVSLWQRSGLTVREYWLQHHLSEPSFYA